MSKELFLSEQHSVSNRFAILEDNGTSAWLYLTEPNLEKPVASVWVYNRIPAPPNSELDSYRDDSPPAVDGYASENALCDQPPNHNWSLVWAADGESVAVTKDDVPVACIVAAQEPGFCVELVKDGPWGNTWSDDLYKSTFGCAT